MADKFYNISNDKLCLISNSLLRDDYKTVKIFLNEISLNPLFKRIILPLFTFSMCPFKFTVLYYQKATTNEYYLNIWFNNKNNEKCFWIFKYLIVFFPKKKITVGRLSDGGLSYNARKVAIKW